MKISVSVTPEPVLTIELRYEDGDSEAWGRAASDVVRAMSEWLPREERNNILLALRQARDRIEWEIANRRLGGHL